MNLILMNGAEMTALEIEVFYQTTELAQYGWKYCQVLHAILSTCLKFNLEKLFLVVAALQPQSLVISSYFRYTCQQLYGLSQRFLYCSISWARHFQQNYFLSEKNSCIWIRVLWESVKIATFSKSRCWNKMDSYIFNYFFRIK